MTLRSYSSPFNLGHKAVERLFDGPVTVQEKIDGSQFSFGMRDGELFCRSRNQLVDSHKPGMFAAAVETAIALYAHELLTEGYTYRGEFLSKPKHNTLAYDRVPKDHIILYDVDRGDQDYLSWPEAKAEAERLGLEFVHTFQINHTPTVEQLDEWLNSESALGVIKIEGLVFKKYGTYGPDKKVLMGKYVSEKFREMHSKDWKERNPSQKSFVAKLVSRYATESRWDKAIQHLREAGELQNEMRDIPKLMEEINRDVLADAATKSRTRYSSTSGVRFQRD